MLAAAAAAKNTTPPALGLLLPLMVGGEEGLGVVVMVAPLPRVSVAEKEREGELEVLGVEVKASGVLVGDCCC